MKILVTSSAGHLGEALMRTLQSSAHEATGIDVRPSHFTHAVGSVADRAFVARCMSGVGAVLHTAAPHSRTSSRTAGRRLSTPTSPAR